MFWLINFASQWHHLHLRLARWLSLNTLMHFSASSCQLFLFLCNSEFIASGILIFDGFFSSLLFVSDHHRNKNCFCQFACLHCLCIPTHRQNYKKKSATVMKWIIYIKETPSSEKVCLSVYCTFGQQEDWKCRDLPRTSHVNRRRDDSFSSLSFPPPKLTRELSRVIWAQRLAYCTPRIQFPQSQAAHWKNCVRDVNHP